MMQAERQKKILELLEQHNYVSFNYLIDVLGASKSTLRRDLFDLEKQNKLVRIRGGAALQNDDALTDNISLERSFWERHSSNLAEKQRIAQAALNFIQPDDTILIDSGSTTYELGLRLKEYSSNLMVATNDLHIAIELSSNNDINLIVIGGENRKNHFSLEGYFGERMLSEMHADTTFIGAGAIDINHGLMDLTTDAVKKKQAMINASREVIVLCDHTKFESIAFVRITKLSEIDRIITGKEINPSTYKYLKENGIDVILV